VQAGRHDRTRLWRSRRLARGRRALYRRLFMGGKKRALLIVGAVLAVGAVPAAAAPVGQIAEFSSGLNSGSYLWGIAPGADGNVWFTDEGSTKAIGQITPSGQITEFSAGLLAGSDPAFITTGADGNLWFTDAGSTRAIGRITPSGQITEFSTGLKAGSYPAFIAPGADGNLWFTDEGSTSAIGQIGAGAPAASQTLPAVTGSDEASSSQSCAGESWSTWAGEQPSASAFAFDGYQWLLDGAPVGTGASYTPSAAQVGHQLSCRVTVTYPLPLMLTVSATSPAVTVVQSAPPPTTTTTTPTPPTPPTPTPSVTGVRQSHRRWREGSKLATFARKLKPPVGTIFSFTLNEQAPVSFAFTQQLTGRKVNGRCVAVSNKDRHKRLCNRTLVRGKLSFTGHAGNDKVFFDGRLSRSGKLKPGSYTLVISATNAAGHTSTSSTLSFTIVS
jgi:hypothetical protein